MLDQLLTFLEQELCTFFFALKGNETNSIYILNTELFCFRAVQ